MKKNILIIALFSICTLSFGQKTGKELKADKAFELYDYKKAIKKYTAIENLSTEGKRNLAESYRVTFNMQKAEETYSELVQSEDRIPDDLYYYSFVLKENQKYLESDQWMNSFKEEAATDNRVKHFVESQTSVENLLKDNGRFKIKNLNINTDQGDFGPSFYGDEIVFASTRSILKLVNRKWRGNDLSFLDLYVAERDSLLEFTSLKTFNKKTNKKFHEGPASFAKSGSYLAFTRNNYKEKSEITGRNLVIFFSEKVNDSWTDPEPFKLNNKEYSVAHPHLSEDGNIMYFSSNMPGGYGESDIYRIVKNSEGEWGEPENLGAKVNTEGDEMFPFFHSDAEILLFASDGHVGLGGLDLFVSKINNGAFEKVENLGTPINSNLDDFSFILDSQMKEGYFASNRRGGKGDDDIYSFFMLKPFVFGKLIQGVAKDKDGNLLSNVVVNLYEDGEIISSSTTDDKGNFSFTTEADKNFTIDGNKEKYFLGKTNVSTKTTKEKVKTELTLEKDPGISMYLLVKDAKTKELLEGVTVRIIDNMTGQEFLKKTTTNTGDLKKGLAGKKIGEQLSYNITASKPGYFPKTLTFNHEIDKAGEIEVHKYFKGGLSLDKEVHKHLKDDLSLDKEVHKYLKDDLSLDKEIQGLAEINPIKFDLNKFNIRKDAQIELDKIVEVMNKYPGMVVELGAHTDCRGSAKYNEILSDKSCLLYTSPSPRD